MIWFSWTEADAGETCSAETSVTTGCCPILTAHPVARFFIEHGQRAIVCGLRVFVRIADRGEACSSELTKCAYHVKHTTPLWRVWSKCRLRPTTISKRSVAAFVWANHSLTVLSCGKKLRWSSREIPNQLDARAYWPVSGGLSKYAKLRMFTRTSFASPPVPGEEVEIASFGWGASGRTSSSRRSRLRLCFFTDCSERYAVRTCSVQAARSLSVIPR